MNATERLEDDLSCVLNELLGVVAQEEVVFKHGRTLLQHLLRLAKVKLDVQTRQTDFKSPKIDNRFNSYHRMNSVTGSL